MTEIRQKIESHNYKFLDYRKSKSSQTNPVQKGEVFENTNKDRKPYS